MKRIIDLIVLAILLVAYLSTLQTIPNGSEHYYMIDVGETQNVLNQWGTLHATGYPLYVMVGNILVAGLRALGITAATAPGLTSLIYGMIALALMYMLAVHVQEPAPQLANINEGTSKIQVYVLAGGMVLLYGLTRTVWVHESIAEVYSFGLMILVALFLIALWREPIRGRVYWLALLGGIGAFHHRAIAMAAPALIYAVCGEIIAFTPNLRRPSAAGQAGKNRFKEYWPVVRRVAICLVLGLLGFLQYLYLPLRANAGAKWVYGEPGTWNGFWDQFLGREASRFIGTPTTNAGLIANFNLVNNVLITDVTLAGILLGLIGLIIALWNPARRKVAVTMLISGGVAYGFHVLYYTDILSALILPVTLALAFGWLLLAERVIQLFNHTDTVKIQENLTAETSNRKLARRSIAPMVVLGIVVAVSAGYLIAQNQPFIREMTTNPTGLETIELAKGVPDGAVLMLDWGPRYYAVAFAQDLLGELPTVTLVTHKADFKRLVNTDRRELVTADFTFYNRPVSWWEEQLGRPVYLQSAGSHLVEIGISPIMATVQDKPGVVVNSESIVCKPTMIELQVNWVATGTPDHDLSVYVHLLDKDGAMIAQADESAPVYGWRPLTSWLAGEVVHDVYALPRLSNADSIAYGLYRQLSDGSFDNEYTFNTAVKCDE
ncbi:MAG: DUF2723 domain-containing protein [Anaerolineaceae bacterium]|nr:DUF2723 domain-containing protein [Anaerolineaceae bacterium]